MHSLNVSNGAAGARLPGGSVAPDAGSTLSAEAYSRRHEITVTVSSLNLPHLFFLQTRNICCSLPCYPEYDRTCISII